MKYLLLCLLFASACGSDKPVKVTSGDPPAAFLEKRANYLKWNRELLETPEQKGFVNRGCDATLFSGLRGTYAAVDLRKAELSPGEWTRRDLTWGNCWPLESKSQISRDMLTGIAWWVWRNKFTQEAKEILDYASANNGVMGPGDPFRTGIRGGLRATFERIAGISKPNQELPIVTFLERGYERHLAALHILLRAEIDGKLSVLYHPWILRQTQEQPKNPIYEVLKAKYITGNWRKFYEIMLDPTYFPGGKLPTNEQFCEHDWLYSRDYDGKDWKPCAQEKGLVQHTGSEWLFAAFLAPR